MGRTLGGRERLYARIRVASSASLSKAPPIIAVRLRGGLGAAGTGVTGEPAETRVTGACT